ncbi:unnamed protein product [Rhizophagus irregularis]|nr:unnamed protein product [Rhizophagus irregularis]
MNKVEENYTSSRLFTSKIHNFGSLPGPRNATEEEQEVNDFNKSSKRYSKSSKIITIFRDSNKKLSNLFKKLQIKSNNDEKEITQQHVDDELEIPDDGFE